MAPEISPRRRLGPKIHNEKWENSVAVQILGQLMNRQKIMFSLGTCSRSFSVIQVFILTSPYPAKCDEISINRNFLVAKAWSV